MQKYLTLPNGRKILMNTPAEDAAVMAGIAQDPDTYEVSATEFKQLRKPGRPAGSVAASTKVPVKVRIDPDVLAAFRATGRGWQTRMNALMREAVEQGKVHA